MGTMFSHLWACIKGPRVYRTYQSSESVPYSANSLEHGSQQVIKSVMVLFNISLYASPMILMYLWKRENRIFEAAGFGAKFVAGVSLVVFISLAVRGIGRAFNPTYNSFLVHLKETSETHSKKKLSHSLLASSYDCDFWALPVSFTANGSARTAANNSLFKEYFSLGGLASHLFGRHLIYPGSVHLLQFAIGQFLEEGRANLVVKEKGTRSKIETFDGNVIDTVFVDKRGVSPEGNTLVICCEGNAGFYEVGIVSTPLKAGYSTLGWNTPGFAYSSGLPFPDQTENAVDGVMQFALNKLGFVPENILVYGWSIGGYPASWLAMNYPDIRGLVLDATFDHVLPLAEPRMPAFMSGLVKSTIRDHFNLCNGLQTTKYNGPLSIIRRKHDEIITTVEGDMGTNRANDLLEMVLRARYPKLTVPSAVTVLWEYMMAATEEDKAALLTSHGMTSDEALSLLKEEKPLYPSDVGANLTEEKKASLLLYLASKMLLDVDGGHGLPLDSSKFKYPWSVVSDDSFVQVE